MSKESHAIHSVRIAPVDSPDAEQIAALAKAPTLPDGTQRNLFRTLAWHPVLLSRFNAMAGTFVRFSEISAYDREVVILRVAGSIRSRYELGQHLRIAREAGLTDEMIASIVSLDQASTFSGSERALVTFTDEMLENGNVSNETWASLSATYNEAALVELVMLVGQYRAVGEWLNVLGVELEGDLESLVRQWVAW